LTNKLTIKTRGLRLIEQEIDESSLIQREQVTADVDRRGTARRSRGEPHQSGRNAVFATHLVFADRHEHEKARELSSHHSRTR
jgi:hypothetical protein